MKLKKVSKKILSGMLASCMILTSISCAFTDLSQNHWAYDAVEKMVDNNVISGYTDGTFRPSAEITRAEFATILVKTLEIKNENTIVEFEDVEGKHWAEEFIDLANPFLTGYSINGKYYFKPDDAAIREDAAVAIVRAKGLADENINENILNKFSDKNSISENLRKYVAIAVENGFMKGNVNGEFNPKGHLTRAEVAALFNNINEYEEKLVIGELEVKEKEELPELEFDEGRRALSIEGNNWDKYELAMGFKNTEKPGSWYEPYTQLKVRSDGRIYLKDIGYPNKTNTYAFIRLKADPDAGYNSVKIKEVEELPELEFDEDRRAISLSTGSTNWEKYELATESAMGGPGKWYKPYTDFEVRGGKVYLKDIGYSHQPADGKVYIRLKANPDAGYNSIRIKEEGIEMPEFDGEVVDLGADWSKFEVATDSPRGSGRPGSWYTPAGRKVTVNKLYKLNGKTYGDKSAEYIFVKYDGEVIGKFEIEQEIEMPEFDGEVVDLGADWSKFEVATDSPRGSGRPGSWYTPAGRKVTVNKLYKLNGKTYGDKSAEYIFVKYDGEVIGKFEIEKEIVYGDVNEDGEVNLADIMILAKYINTTESTLITSQGLKNADVNLDKKLNGTDLSVIVAFHYEKNIQLPAKDVIAYGDLDSDGKITLFDIEVLEHAINYNLDLDKSLGDSQKNADFNGDGKVDIHDVNAMKEYLGDEEEKSIILRLNGSAI